MSTNSKNQKLSLTRYIPRNIDLEDLLRQYPTPVPNVRDYLVYLLDLIHSVPAFKKDYDIEANDGFTNLHSKYLKTVVDNYSLLMQWLKERGIIEDKPHLKGAFAKGYRFTEPYRLELKEQVITLQTLIRKITQRKKLKDHVPYLKPEHLFNFHALEKIHPLSTYSSLAAKQLSYLRESFKGLTLDKDFAERYLREKLTEDQNNSLISQPMHRFNQRMLVVYKITSGDWLFYVDDTSGRLHTTLTSLKSELRAGLRHNNRLLSSADIKNSQPVLSLVFLDEALLMKNNMLHRLALYNPKFTDVECSNLFSHSTMFRNLVRSSSQAADVQLYRELVLSGRLYDYFGQQLASRGIAHLSGQDLRKYAKTEIFGAFFSRNQANSRPDNHGLHLFRELFPAVYEIFSQIKSGNHNALACALQNLEAEVVLFKSCGELAGNYPGLPLFTIHDSIATYREDIDTVKEALSRNIAEVIGATPEIKIEHWDEALLEVQQEQVNVLQQQPVSLYGYVDDESATTSYQYTRSLRTAARQLSMPPLKFNALLRERGILQSDRALRNVPFDQYIEAGYFIVKEKSIRQAGLKKVTKVTSQGMVFLENYLKGR